VLQSDNRRLLRAAELAAGGVDTVAFAVAEFHANAGLFQDRAERLATLGRRRLIGGSPLMRYNSFRPLRYFDLEAL
jgi:2-methylisocitrate lyase-like PEP mutase family enzyme